MGPEGVTEEVYGEGVVEAETGFPTRNASFPCARASAREEHTTFGWRAQFGVAPLLSGDEWSTPLAMPRVALKPSRAVAELLRTKRQELGLTLREVEKKTAEAGELIPFPSLARVEQGRADPGVKRLHLLLRLYQVPSQLVSDVVELEDLAGILPTSRDAKRLYDEGLRHWKRGEQGRGIAHLIALQRLLKDNPKERLFRQETTVSLAIMAGSLGNYHLSLDLIGKLLREPPEESLLASVLVQAAVCWHRLGSGEAALAFLERAEKHLEPHAHKERAWVFHEKASTLTTLGRYAEAAETLKRVIAAHPESVGSVRRKQGSCRARQEPPEAGRHPGRGQRDMAVSPAHRESRIHPPQDPSEAYPYFGQPWPRH